MDFLASFVHCDLKIMRWKKEFFNSKSSQERLKESLRHFEALILLSPNESEPVVDSAKNVTPTHSHTTNNNSNTNFVTTFDYSQNLQIQSQTLKPNSSESFFL